MLKKIILVWLLLLNIFIINGENLNLWSETAISVDLQTEQILFSKNPNLVIPPASMTKLVNLYITYKEIEKGNANFNDLVPISANADFKNLPRDSSLMFIEQNQRVTLKELMIGLAIPSGNDAAIAIAEYLFGSVSNYLDVVNNEMEALGLTKLKFTDASGFDDNNQITVMQFVQFCIILIKEFPEVKELFALESFTYPLPNNGYSSIGGITQYNHNPLIGIYPGLDGLKTGFINKSGMNISLTATKNGRTVVAVIAGVKDPDKSKASSKRFYDAITLLNYSFDSYKSFQLDKILLPPLYINNRVVDVFIPYKSSVLLNRDYKITYSIDSDANIDSKFSFVGYVNFESDSINFKYPIYLK